MPQEIIIRKTLRKNIKVENIVFVLEVFYEVGSQSYYIKMKNTKEHLYRYANVNELQGLPAKVSLMKEDLANEIKEINNNKNKLKDMFDGL